MGELTLPMPRTEAPARSVLLPTRGDIVPARPLVHPAARHPDVPVAVPSPIARYPHVIRARRWDRLDHQRRWRYADGEVNIDARGNVRYSDRERCHQGCANQCVLAT